ncbi:MAG: PorP/SprF family type IX secretion system membrane protein [Bacteroidaceae bacterium]|nr:PorP/SprF family type IX secretion system membrane protein [Bacteroidaceae bacterium]
MRLRQALLIILLGFCVKAVAQYDAAFNHYWTLQSFFNPAATGLEGQVNIQGAYSMQMLGYTHAPATMVLTADIPVWFIGPAHGIGAGFLNDKIGLFAHKKFFIQYAYHQKLWGGRLSFGTRVGMLSETFDGSGVDVEESGDPAFVTSQADGTAFDLDFGLRYDGKVWYAGFSAIHLLAPTIELGEAKANYFDVPATFYLTGGYNIQLRNPLFKLQTSAILRTDLAAWRGDVTARLAYNGPRGKFYGGLAYSPTNSVSVLLGGMFHGIQLGYCYEIYTGGVGIWQGTHELTIGYLTELNLFKKGRNRHQSVRIL